MEGKIYYRFLLEGYMNGTASDEEIADLFQEIGKGEDDQGWKELIQEIVQDAEKNPEYDKSRWHPMLQNILATNSSNNEKGKKVTMQWKWMAAAAVILIIATGIIYFLKSGPDDQIVKSVPSGIDVASDIAPGIDKAILTLADGSTIILDSTAKGAITTQGNVTVINMEGKLAYQNVNAVSGEVMYNTITTPRGGQYQLVLADGTKVWLNAASSLKFPTAFNSNERRVELKGEGYFEVAHDEKKSFWVDNRKGSVQVIGTHFNINAYDDESTINTTLLEGSIKIHSDPAFVILKPGQQSVLNEKGEIKINKVVDVEEVMAWKNGNFQFGEAMNIQMIMRQLARWYNIEVEYQTGLTGHVGGTISRNVNVSKVLAMIEMTGAVKFKINGRKVIVIPG